MPGEALLWRVRSNVLLPVLEPLGDGSWRSVLVSPRIDPRGAARRDLLAAAGRGEDLPEDQARYVRVLEYGACLIVCVRGCRYSSVTSVALAERIP